MSIGPLINGVPGLSLLSEDKIEDPESALLLKKHKAGVYASQQMRTSNGKVRHYPHIQ